MSWLQRIVGEALRIRLSSATAYAVAIGLVVVSLVVRLALGDALVGAPLLTFLPAIILAAFIGGLGPGLVATALGATAGWFVLIPAGQRIAPLGIPDVAAMALFLFVAGLLCLMLWGFQVAMGHLREAQRLETEAAVELEHMVEQRTAELQANQARLRTIFETSYIYQGLLTPEGNVLDANAASLSGIKSTLADVVGKPFSDTPWFTGTNGMPETVRAAIATVAAGGTVRQQISVNLPEGGWRWFDFTMRPLRDDDGAVIAIVPEAAEITERHRAEEVLRQSQKMEAVGKLTGGLAHDFNNLLTGIIGNLELMRSRLSQGRTNELSRHITAAAGAAERAASLTHRLLSFARQQTLDPKPTNLNHLVAGLEDLIRRTVDPEINVDVIAANGLWSTLVDQNQLENAILNLCINARDAMEGGGRLTIETANCAFDEPAAGQRDLLAGEYVLLTVGDTGGGMSEEVISRAFEPFFTTKPLGSGTGLGLSMVYGFMRQSGGQARIESTLGAGTTVSLYLPRHAVEEVALTAHGGPGEMPRARRGETVLVVDDEPSVRALVEDVLEELDYVSIQADDGASGLRILESGRRIDLLITDIGLPGGMDGRELAETGVAMRPDLKVLLITGYAENALAGSVNLKPGMHLLTKPFGIDVLAGQIRNIISRG